MNISIEGTSSKNLNNSGLTSKEVSIDVYGSDDGKRISQNNSKVQIKLSQNSSSEINHQ